MKPPHAWLRSTRRSITAVGLLVLSGVATTCTAQSTPVAVPTRVDNRPGGSRSAVPPRPLIPTSMPEATRKLIARLEQPSAVPFPAGMKLDKLPSVLERAGIVAMVDTPSLDRTDLPANPDLKFSSSQLPLGKALWMALNPLELTYTIESGRLVILSEEAASERLTTVIYDYTATGITSFDDVRELLENTVSPDEWETNGGAATMEALDHARPLLIISAPLSMHHDVLELLTDAARLGKDVRPFSWVGQSPLNTPSSVVQVPGQVRRRGMLPAGSGNMGVFRGGGLGGGMGP